MQVNPAPSRRRPVRPVVLAALAVVLAAPARALSPEERAARADSVAAELARRVDLLAGEIERLRLGEAAAAADQGQYGLGPAASKVYRTERGVSIGGYGEMLYQHFEAKRDDRSPAGRIDELDFLRGIVYFGYKFNDRWLFNSEIEFEHSSTGRGGEASVEFAYIDHLWRPEANLRAGLLLVPMGLLNELHEPTVFLGARRPAVETAILPSTWRENGVGVFGEAGPVSYRTYVMNGFDARGFSAAGLRGGRQKGAQAKADDFAWVGRLDLAATPGLLVGASAYAGQSAQGLATPEAEPLQVPVTIAEGHAEWKWRGLEVRALGALASLDEVAELDRSLDPALTGNASVGERLTGYYMQAGYDLFSLWPRGEASLVPFVRWESLDTQADVPAGFSANPASDADILTVGAAFHPIDPVVVKIDYQDLDNGAGKGLDQLNVALGYIF